MHNIIKKIGDQIFIEPKKEYLINGAFTSINIQETKEVNDTEHGTLRMYRDYIGDSTKNENGFTLQIRAFQSLTDTTKKRNIIASISITDSEIRALAEFVKISREQYNTVKLKR